MYNKVSKAYLSSQNLNPRSTQRESDTVYNFEDTIKEICIL